jgi:adenosylhomocysteine nucleosidase
MEIQEKYAGVVLICADAEWAAIRNVFPTATPLPSAYGECFSIIINVNDSSQGYMLEKPSISESDYKAILFFHSGWGKIASAGATQYVIDRWSPGLIANLGTCGGFKGLIEQDQVLLVNQAIVYDICEQMGDQDAHIRHFTTNIDLEWCKNVDLTGIIRGLILSGDRDLIPEEIPSLHNRYGALAGDWESGAIAYVAARNAVRTLILRGVSDLVGNQGSEAYQNIAYFQQSADRIMKRLLEILLRFLPDALI